MVLLTGLFILGFLAYRTYSAAPPVPGRVVTLAGRVLFTATDIQDGQKAFLRWGLMEYGSIYGHGRPGSKSGLSSPRLEPAAERRRGEKALAEGGAEEPLVDPARGRHRCNHVPKAPHLFMGLDEKPGRPF